VPTAPLAVRVRVLAENCVQVQFNLPRSDGGQPISGYKVQYDFNAAFNSGTNDGPFNEVDIPSSSVSPRQDIQLVSVVSKAGFHPAGTFVLIFDGLQTGELDFNISAVGMKTALEKLTSINTVNVERFLFCSQETGRNNCNNERGYTWRITFVDVILNGNQWQEYLSSYSVLLII